MTFSQTLNARQRPETLQLKNGAGTTLQSLTYGYSAEGDVTWILDGVDGADTVNNLTYDGLHRLKTANGIWGSYSYTYDGLNNLISRTGTNPLSYGYDTVTNRLSSVAGLAAPPAPAPSPAPSPNPKPIDPCGGFVCTPPATTASFSNLSGATAVTQTVTTATRTYSYNSRGAMVSDGIRSFTLNANDQITSITGIATYGYDGNGKRIITTKADGTTEYTLYDASGTLATHFLRGGAGVTTNYLQLGGKTIVEAANGVPTYLHADLLGSPRLGTNASGSTVWREHYGPYGEKLNGVNDKIGYTGHAYDAESQLTYAQARFYDPAVGRFMSMDPIGFTGNPASFTRYAYANNNPFAFTDPTGVASAEKGSVGKSSDCTGSRICNGKPSQPLGSSLGAAGVYDAQRSAALAQRDATAAGSGASGGPAPEAAGKREPGEIYVTGHRVLKLGPYHLALEYNGQVISAGPEGGLLVSDPNRRSDVGDKNVTIGEVQPPAGMSAGDYFSRVKQADRSYCDCVDYDLFPGISNSYSSNSYVHGLINATDGATSVNFNEYYGGPKPLPSQYFGGQ